MKSNAFEHQTSDVLVQRFVDICIAQDEALKDLNTRHYNKLYDQMAALIAELKSRGGDQRSRLVGLYSHSNAQVRLKAAIHTLAHDPEKAMAVLQQIVDAKEEPQVPYAWGILDAVREGRYEPD